MSGLYRDRAEQSSRFGIAQVCLNGHDITGDYEGSREFRKNYCDQCGAKTIRQCPSCGTNIQGYYFGGSITVTGYTPPKHCYNCGEPFPWTKTKVEAARALLDLEEGLSNEDKADLRDSLDALTKDTPWTKVAAEKWKRARPHIAKGLWQLVVDVGTEAAKKALIP